MALARRQPFIAIWSLSARADRSEARREDDSGGGPDHEDGPAIHSRPRDGQTDLRRGGAARTEERHARRGIVADAAVSAQAASAGAHESHARADHHAHS